MRSIWNNVCKDVSRARRDPVALLIWVTIPLILGTLINAVFGGSDASPQGRLLIADEDGTFISNVVASAFSREPLGKMLLVEKVTRETGRARIDRGDGSALLIIPKGFADAVLGNDETPATQPFRLLLFTNPAQSVLPGIVREVLSTAVEGDFYLQQVGRTELSMFTRRNTPPTDEEIATYSVAINHALERLRKYLDPPVIRLETTVAKENSSRKTVAAVMFPTLMFMGILFTASGLASDIWKERNAGALRRLRTTPSSMAAFLSGRLVFVVLVFAMFGLAGVSVSRWLAGVPVASFAGAVLWLTFSGSVFFLLLLFVVMQAETQRGASVLVNLVVFPASMLGGCFFPFDAMPPWMVRIGDKLPNAWAVLRFYDILDGVVNAKTLALAGGGLVLLGAIAFMLSLRKLRGSFAL